jgi:hypothetical protein
MRESTLAEPIMQARDLLAAVVAVPDAMEPLSNLDVQLAASDLEALWHGQRPPARPHPQPSTDVPGDLERARQLLHDQIARSEDVPTAIRLAEIIHQLHDILDAVRP